jgi:hypothetical protein
MSYEFQLTFKAFLTAALAADIVLPYNVTGNTPTLRQSFVTTFNGCAPSMNFEAKRAAYGALELIAEAVAASGDVTPANVAIINDLLVLTTRYVGLAEGDAENFNYMVAAYQLAKELAEVLDETPAYGTIATLTLANPGAGFTIDGTDDTAEDVVFVVSSTAAFNPAGYATGRVTAEIIDGEIDSLTLIIGVGDGFFVGQTVRLNISTIAPQTGATQTTPATAVVASIG